MCGLFLILAMRYAHNIEREIGDRQWIYNILYLTAGPCLGGCRPGKPVLRRKSAEIWLVWLVFLSSMEE